MGSDDEAAGTIYDLAGAQLARRLRERLLPLLRAMPAPRRASFLQKVRDSDLPEGVRATVLIVATEVDASSM